MQYIASIRQTQHWKSIADQYILPQKHSDHLLESQAGIPTPAKYSPFPFIFLGFCTAVLENLLERKAIGATIKGRNLRFNLAATNGVDSLNHNHHENVGCSWPPLIFSVTFRMEAVCYFFFLLFSLKGYG
ncbi:hypothetical protein BOTBODRAFT_524998 [Botryobasidium botryosum FD-172 SS1]|uniref:Uncharacterized protein n=1 Tax=Botryobasidium botryosum (strain FD-172 SS1) TaxID=930990 RepID=A0A067M198_BOTB1|nr:hypothetical protein BOTBODRAFT_524998 [Botryobasidium botryosum FD-172 SS1]